MTDRPDPLPEALHAHNIGCEAHRGDDPDIAMETHREDARTLRAALRAVPEAGSLREALAREHAMLRGPAHGPEGRAWRNCDVCELLRAVPEAGSRCAATQQTETWGLMWCGLFTGHEPHDHVWFSEDQRRAVPEAGSHLDTECRNGSCRFAVVRHTHDVPSDGVYAWEVVPETESRERLRTALSDAVRRASVDEMADAFIAAIEEGTFTTYEALRHATYELVARAALGDTQEDPSPHAHEWTDDPDDEEAWYCLGCGVTEYPWQEPRPAASPAAPETDR